MTFTGKEGVKRHMGRVRKGLKSYFESKNKAQLKMHIESEHMGITHTYMWDVWTNKGHISNHLTDCAGRIGNLAIVDPSNVIPRLNLVQKMILSLKWWVVTLTCWWFRCLLTTSWHSIPQQYSYTLNCAQHDAVDSIRCVKSILTYWLNNLHPKLNLIQSVYFSHSLVQ